MKNVKVNVEKAFEFETAKEVEIIRASLDMRAKHIKAELEKPLAAGVAAILKKELRDTCNLRDNFAYIKELF